MDNQLKLRQIIARPAATLALLGLLIIPTLFCGGGGSAGDVDATVAAGIAATQQAQLNLQATIDAAVAATQSAQPSTGDRTPAATGSPATPAAVDSRPEPEQVRAVILNEVNASVAQDLDTLEAIYAPTAVVIDRNGTPTDTSDDTVWQGWPNIERRYLAFFSAGHTAINLVDLSIQVDGNQATGTHQGTVLDGVLYPDLGVYTLEKINGEWLISQLEYGNIARAENLTGAAAAGQTTVQPGRDDGLYVLEVGSQHRYEQPWGWDRGDPCQAWETDNFDDTKPYYRGFNVELLLTNNSESKAPDAWPISFTTARGKVVKACYYGYEGSGPSPRVTSSVTFFTVVEQGDYVELITFSLNDQTVQLCLDGKGGWSRCSQ